MRSAIAAGLAAIVLLLAGDSDHAQALTTRTLGVGVRVDTRCQIVANGLHFPDTYVALQVAPLDAVTNLVVDCDPGRKASIRLDQGVNPSPGSTPKNPLRRMRSGATANYLSYNLYEDAARTIVWDDARPGVMTSRSWPVTIPVYGRIDGGQAVIPGLYEDVVVANLFF